MRPALPLGALVRGHTCVRTTTSITTFRRPLATMAPGLVDGAAAPASLPIAAGMAAAPVAAPTKSSSHVMHRHLGVMPLKAIRAEGCYIYGENRRFLDACGGAAVVSVGHGDKRMIAALTEQLNSVNYVHSGNWATDCSEELAEVLCADANERGGDFARAYFALGGSEAVESAVKLARQHFVEKGELQRTNFIGRDQGFNGNTLGCLALGGHKGRRKHFEPMLASGAFHKVSPCYAYRHQKEGESEAEYVARLETELEAKFQELGPETVAAFCAETVVGATTGCVPAVKGYFQACRRVCDRHGALFILDEVMSGMGRTGTLHAWEQEGVIPDIFTVAKGISGGYAPLSAVLASRKVIEPIERGSKVFVSGFTFQSYSCGTRAGLEVQKILKSDRLVERCAEMGVFLEAELHRCLDDHPNVGNIRGRGLFWGVEFVADKGTKEPFSPKVGLSSRVVDDAISKGVVMYTGSGTADGVAGDHILICPPYTITREQLTEVVETLRAALDDVLAQI